MTPRERKAREDMAFFLDLAATKYPPGHQKHRGTLAVAWRLLEIATEEALAGVDLSLASLFAPTLGDALALRGERFSAPRHVMHWNGGAVLPAPNGAHIAVWPIAALCAFDNRSRARAIKERGNQTNERGEVTCKSCLALLEVERKFLRRPREVQ